MQVANSPYKYRDQWIARFLANLALGRDCEEEGDKNVLSNIFVFIIIRDLSFKNY